MSTRLGRTLLVFGAMVIVIPLTVLALLGTPDILVDAPFSAPGSCHTNRF